VYDPSKHGSGTGNDSFLLPRKLVVSTAYRKLILAVGLYDGEKLGVFVGFAVGEYVGDNDGDLLGYVVGLLEGATEGKTDGLTLG
jgi:hypothetical protein